MLQTLAKDRTTTSTASGSTVYGSILDHRDEERKIKIHVYEDLIGDSPQDIRPEVEFDHAVINVPWPLGLTLGSADTGDQN